ncbi:MAG: hypothetical protein PHI48_06275 [Bacteroidales bacterium]|nr:hypothetical protein [Bacteroidales bacterium]
MELEERLNAIEQKFQGVVAEKDAKIQALETELSGLKDKSKEKEDSSADELLNQISVPAGSKVGTTSNGQKTADF